MPAPELRIRNRAAYFRKAIKTPDFSSERVLAHDAFQFAELWLKRECPHAVPFWDQARSYYEASKHLPAQSSPLTSYYCFLNAAKTLLTVKGVDFSDRHGVTGNFDPESKRALRNEKIIISEGGILGKLSHFLEEKEESEHTLKDILSNLPFIHRAYRYTFRSHPELFVPVYDLSYREEKDYVWVTATIDGRYADGRYLSTLPEQFEIDKGYTDKCVIRTKQKVKWHSRKAPPQGRQDANARLQNYHRRLRQDFVYISSAPDLWYIKREMAEAKNLRRYTLTLIMAAMHRLSELSRYDPKGLKKYLDGKENWLLTEFIQLSPNQFIDELVSEMTSLEFGARGIRPRTT
jgi:hypothetical protein